MLTPVTIINLWPSAEQFARDLGLGSKDYVRVMRHRNRIPRVWWPDLIRAARKRRLPVTRDALLEAHKAAGKPAPAKRRA
jgi:hypothetical protein